jgi:hypothetical protein
MYQAIKDAYFLEEMKADDLSKIMKFANNLWGPNTSSYTYSVDNSFM